MRKRGPFDFPPKGPESDEDQESETQPEIPPGADLATADQGAGVPVQHQSSGSELTYRLSQPIHQSAQLQPLSPHLESASSFTCDEDELPSLYPKSLHKSAPSSPLKLSSPNVTRSSSVPAFVYPTQVPSLLSYRNTQLFTSSSSSLALESSTSSQPPQDYSCDQQFQAQSFPQVTAIEQLELSGNQPLHSQQPQLQTYEPLQAHQQSDSYYQAQLYEQLQDFATHQLAEVDSNTASDQVPSSASTTNQGLTGQVPGSYRSSQFSFASESSSPSQSNQDYLSYQQSDLQSHPQFSPSDQLQLYQQSQPETYDQFQPQQQSHPQTYGHPSHCLSYQQSDLQSQPQFSPSDQLQLYQQSQPQTYDQFQQYQQSRSYQQLQQYEQSQSSPTLQSVAPDLAFAPFSLRTQQGSTRQMSGNPSEKATCKRQFPCGFCEEATSFDSEIELKKHRKSVHKKKRCGIDGCSFANVNQVVLEKHKKENHKGELDTHNIQQPNLGAAKPDSPKSSDPVPSLSSSDEGSVHTSRKPRKRSKKGNVKCEIDNCTHIFKDEHTYSTHVAQKHKAKQCTKCDFRSTSKQKLNDHMIENHPDCLDTAQKVAFPTYSPEPNSQPPVSNTGPSSSQPNPLPEQGKPTKERANRCLECGKQSSSEHHFKIHKKLHLKFKCRSCETFYNDAKGLDDHKKSIFHTRAGNLRIYCKHCVDEFETLREFKRHCEYLMIKGRPEICPTCGEPYDKLYRMIRHYALQGDEHFDVCAPSLVEKPKRG